MKTYWRRSLLRAFTILELFVVVVVVFLLAALILPALTRPHDGRIRINCVNNLKQVGLAFRLWSGDNGDKYPMAYAGNTNYPLINRGNAWANDDTIVQYQYTIFAAMSNELSTPKIVACPQDKRVAATNFTTDFNNSHISYFVGLDADETRPQAFLAGDRNLNNGQSSRNGLFSFQTNQVIGWTKDLHNKTGNVAFGDGSVQQLRNDQINAALAKTGLATNRLLFP
jgi:prepilin-type processing-associated H-X9-DG protein